MRSFAFFFAFLSPLGLQAQGSDSARAEQTLEHIRHFASSRLERVSCVEASSPGVSKTVTVEFSSPRHGVPSNIDTGNLLQEVFAPSSQTEFHLGHWGTINGKTVAIYNYSFQIHGKTHAGVIYADENTGVISRVTFRGADAPAHLFCSANTR